MLWLLLGFAMACDPPTAPAVEEPTRPVRVELVKSELRPVRLRYIGATGSQSIKKYSFKVAGRVQAVFVDKGQPIRRGQRLAQLDPRDLHFSLEGAQLTLNKAEEGLKDARSLHEKMEKLYGQQARSQLEYDRAKLNLDISEASFRQAQVDVEYKQGLLGDTSLRSEVDGFVVEVLNKPGEVVGAGYPVVVVRNDVQVVQVGVAQRDVPRLKIGGRALIDVDGVTIDGRISQIAQIPDPRSRTYEVEVEMLGPPGERAFYLGAIARVEFEVGEAEGMWVPIQSLLTDGVDHVFVVEAGRAVRRNLVLGSISGTRVQVQGLRDGDQLIVEGMKNLKEGYQVAVLSAPVPGSEDAGERLRSSMR
ncbi:MAG: efflux RND transporter periplasmic adaptor subunit [Pseudomonadota bacterium]